jgi:signal transduction histidine kinase
MASATEVGTPFDGGGAMGALLAARDWASSSLGPVDAWPQSLRTAVSLILQSRFPMFVFWGPDLVQIYNDAYVPIPGAKHPRSQGAPARETWAEIWDELGPLVERVFAGEATWSEDLLLMMERHGYPEETYFTFSYSPVQDESGGVGGVFCACTETTQQVLSARRLGAVARLADHARGKATVPDAVAALGAALAADDRDLTAAALYLIDGDDGEATLAVSTAWPDDHPLVPDRMTIDDPAAPWPVSSELLADLRPHHVPLLGHDDLPTGAWDVPSHDGVLLPLLDPAGHRPIGVLVGTVSPHRPMAEQDEHLSLLRDTIAKALGDASAREREQERLVAMAELDHAKTEFYSSISHEFRTPLTLMLAPLEQAVTAAEMLPPDASAQVLRNAQRMLKLVNHLLAFSRLEAGRDDLAFAPFELAGLTEEIASSFRAAIEDAGLTFNVACAPLARDVYVDRGAWERIVLNLLSNAFKFTHSGTIDVRVSDDGDVGVLAVSDTGVGVPEEHLGRLFERFHRVPGTEGRSYEGSGIGLALVRDLVELHGGTIEVTSEVGRGTTFTVRIPFGSDHLPEDQLVAHPVAGPQAATGETYVAEARGWAPDHRLQPNGEGDDPRRVATVLVVDDNADMRRYLAELLSTFVHVETAADGQEALERVRASQPDLVLTDVMMPRMDGFELIGQLRSDAATRSIPIVVLTARAGTEAAGAGLAAGADDYVVKPFSAAELQARVRANLELARLRHESSEAHTRQTLLAGLSHDMQGPLAVALAATELAEDDPAQAPELLRATRRRLLHVRTLLAQLLDQARLQIGRLPRVSMMRVEIGELLEEAIDLVAPNGGVTLEADGPVEASADPDRVRQIAVNLLQNALRMATDTPPRVRLSREPRWAVAEVAVAGVTLDAEAREVVLETLEQRDGDDATGLGLHVSRVLADLQGGSLAVEADGDGTRFVLRIPDADTPRA